jgi:hypothetical protein
MAPSLAEAGVQERLIHHIQPVLTPQQDIVRYGEAPYHAVAHGSLSLQQHAVQ